MRLAAIALAASAAALLLVVPAVSADVKPASGVLSAGGASTYSGTVLKRATGRSLVKTDAPEGAGLAWVHDSLAMQSTGQAPAPDYDTELTRAHALVLSGNDEQAERIFAALLRRDPARKDVRVAYAQNLRRLWRFKPSLVLFEKLIDESPAADLDLMKQAAETAVLMGDARVAAKAIARLRVAAKRDEKLKLYCDALRNQLDGGVMVTFAGRTPDSANPVELARQRRLFDSTMGESFIEAKLAKDLYNFAVETDRSLPERAFARAAIQPNVRTVYMEGGDERLMRQGATRVDVWLMANEQRWTSVLYSWQQRVLLYGMAYKAQEVFPRAKIAVRVVFKDPADPTGKALKQQEGGRADLGPDAPLDVDIKVLGKRDADRDAKLSKERQDYDRRR